MGLPRLRSAAFQSLDAWVSEQTAFVIVGLPDASVKESRDRVLAAVKNAGHSTSNLRGTINLAPGDLRKEGPLYDLPIALGLLTVLSAAA